MCLHHRTGEKNVVIFEPFGGTKLAPTHLSYHKTHNNQQKYTTSISTSSCNFVNSADVAVGWHTLPLSSN